MAQKLELTWYGKDNEVNVEYFTGWKQLVYTLETPHFSYDNLHLGNIYKK